MLKINRTKLKEVLDGPDAEASGFERHIVQEIVKEFLLYRNNEPVPMNYDGSISENAKNYLLDIGVLEHTDKQEDNSIIKKLEMVETWLYKKNQDKIVDAKMPISYYDAKNNRLKNADEEISKSDSCIQLKWYTLRDSNFSEDLADFDQRIQKADKVFVRVIKFLPEHAVIAVHAAFWNDVDTGNEYGYYQPHFDLALMNTTWNYRGLVSNANFFGTQSDWNQTLVTKINEISKKIGKEIKKIGANAIICSHDTLFVIEDMVYYRMESSLAEIDDNGTPVRMGILSGKYVVYLDPLLKDDLIIVTYIPGHEPKTLEKRLTFGTIKLENLNENDDKQVSIKVSKQLIDDLNRYHDVDAVEEVGSMITEHLRQEFGNKK